MIEVQVELLKKCNRTFYWLVKETSISHTTVMAIKERQGSLGINFDTLEKICRALECQPGDVLLRVNQKMPKRRGNTKSASK